MLISSWNIAQYLGCFLYKTPPCSTNCSRNSVGGSNIDRFRLQLQEHLKVDCYEFHVKMCLLAAR